MDTKKLKKITIEINEEHEADFWFTLFRLKAGQMPLDEQALQRLLSAIHLDTENPQTLFTILKSENWRTQERLQNLWRYFNNAQKDSLHYQVIFGNNYEGFIQSSYGQELQLLLTCIEIMLKFRGEEGTANIKIVEALVATFAEQFKEAISSSIKEDLQSDINKALAVQESMQEGFQAQFNEEGKLLTYQNESSEAVQSEMYVQIHGVLHRVYHVSQLNDPTIQASYQQIGGQVIETTITAEGECRVTTYDETVISNGVLDLSASTGKITITMPPDAFNHLQIQSDATENWFTIRPKPSIEELHAGTPVAVESIQHVIIEGQKSNSQATKWMDQIGNAIAPYLALPNNKQEEIEWTDRVIVQIWNQLRRHFPDVSRHSAATIIGFILAQIGILDREERYDSKKKSTHRDYLTNYVINRSRYSKTILALLSK